MKLFNLLCKEEVLAEGVELTNGKVCVSWLVKNKPNSIVIWNSIEDFISISIYDDTRSLIYI